MTLSTYLCYDNSYHKFWTIISFFRQAEENRRLQLERAKEQEQRRLQEKRVKEKEEQRAAQETPETEERQAAEESHFLLEIAVDKLYQ